MSTPGDARADRVVAAMAPAGLDALLVTHGVNVRWLTGFTGTNAAVLLTAGERLFLTDFRYTEQAEKQVASTFERLPAERDLTGALAARLVGRAGFEDAHVSVRAREKLGEKAADGAELVPAGDLLEDLRQVKDAGELAGIGAAAELATAALERVLERGLAGRTEREVMLDLHEQMRRAGAEDPSFAAIVAAGPHGALPHAEPRDVEIPRGVLVVVDWGARLDGLCSDCTRTFATGQVGERAREVYEAVRRIQAQTLDATVAGAECKALHELAAEGIAGAGFGELGHGLGHGVGLEVHELPRLSVTGAGVLEPGNVVTVEPGVYLPGELGVRIEDLVAITDAGHEVLTAFPKQLTEV